MRKPVQIKKGRSNRQIDYFCDDCGRECRRDELLAKVIVWRTLGQTHQIVHSRTVGWVCKRCMEKDLAFKRVARADSHGYADTQLARRVLMARAQEAAEEDENETPEHDN